MELTLDSLIAQATTDNQMTKQASASPVEELTQTLTGEDNMFTKEAQEGGRALAEVIAAALMTKQAENNVIAETDDMKKDDDAKIHLTPVAGKTVTETAKALIERGAAEAGAKAPEEAAEEVQAEGGAQIQEEGVQADLHKQAAEAVSALVDDGVDFDSAVEIVKQAAFEMQSDLEKAAAVSILQNEHGFEWADAVALVKQASEELMSEGMDKQAALDEMIASGMSFDEAVAQLA